MAPLLYINFQIWYAIQGSGGVDMFRIHMFPAEIGDSFLIEVGNSAINHILIDCGTATAWKTNIYPALLKICCVLDLMVITHIDRDHIGGAIEFFSSKAPLPLVVKEVWFNGLSQIFLDKLEESTLEERRILSAIIPPLSPAGIYNSDISFSQGITLSTALYNLSQSWNTSFQGKAISGQCPPAILDNSIKITPILPTRESLDALFAGFQNELRRGQSNIKFHNSLALRDAFERFCYNDRPIFIESQNISSYTKKDIPALANISVVPDKSLTNASSIGFIMEFQNHQALFLGDATPMASIKALKHWREQTGKDLHFDVIKMPHHGSKRNCIELLDHVDSSIFIISSNGTQYDHPSPETIAKIVSRPTKQTRHIVFNYSHSVYKQFNDLELMKKYKYRTSVADTVDIMEDSHDRTT